ncbi:MAG: putative type IIS restriction/modification enzyme [uncultured Campylobacterales bacterium]|uniref:site-specific DNA-methyltransferase (adenine-specific) n=1 Tax=uncultured Campylobacterales bacterium TaxID=352960 RepID=A0A6S6TBE0_9BACT|nr:MAG: putative type IIS restriction/modification enzyme [uncultured Campylobacterales bacterium]
MNQKTPAQSINSQAYKKYKLPKDQVQEFQNHINEFKNKINNKETEENNKKIFASFLEKTFYQNYEINTQDKIDLVIKKTPKDKAEILIELKKPKGNESEMLSKTDLNKRALHELILYYLREKQENEQIKHLIISNSYEWFIFDSSEFRRVFFDNKDIQKIFKQKELNKSTDTNSTKSIYNEFKKSIEKQNLLSNIKYTYFDIRDIKDYSNLYKFLSPTNLLKQSFANDANSLNKKFYDELLYILGLEETKKKPKLIQRKPKETRERGTLLENTILKLQSECGITDEEKLFDIALELNIIWLNRVLFLKLLEGKLIQISSITKKFLSYEDPIDDFDVLNTLFFEVLAKKLDDRDSVMIEQIKDIPYLNSSLFEVNKLESKYLRISNLKDNLTLSIKPNSNLKNDTKYKDKNEINTLEYLLTFLDTYDFGSDDTEDKHEEKKDLINSAVLGLIFEKLNGYKDGSFFTPSFITEYMSRESIRKSLVDKFSQSFDKSFEDFESLTRYIHTQNYNTSFRIKANNVINSITICDPAVGSGHFLVSALNELLLIKSEFGILFEDSKYFIVVENDELYIQDKQDEHIIEYTLKDRSTHHIQKTIFQEKKTIIENQLFGVDINPKSVQITRLRLWIELLKSSYYENNEFQTLPNIDINIKCGNSLISKYDINTKNNKDLDKKLIKEYKTAVKEYKSTNNKTKKQEITNTIQKLKDSFTKELNEYSKEIQNYQKALKSYITDFGLDGLEDIHMLDAIKNGYKVQSTMFTTDDTISKARTKQKENLKQEIIKNHQIIKNIQSNEIYKNSFEWAFEFPEILDENGEFVGFDIVAGNPPYGASLNTQTKEYYKTKYENVHMRTIDTFNYFISMSSKLLNKNSYLSFIVPNNLLYQNEYEKTRNLLLNNYQLKTVINLGDNVFEDASVPTCIIEYKNTKNKDYNFRYIDIRDTEFTDNLNYENYNKKSMLKVPTYTFGINPTTVNLIEKIKTKSYIIDDIALEVASGISTGADKIFRLDENSIKQHKIENQILQNVLVGREINKYETNPTDHKLIYTTRDINISTYPNTLRYLAPYQEKLSQRSETKKGILPWCSLNRQRYKELFTEEKILIRQTADDVIATYDENGYFVLDSILVFKIDKTKCEIKYKFATAILNSKLTTFIYQNYTGESGRGFAQVKPKNIRKLPIPNINKEEQKPFIEIVDKIIELKKQNLDTTELESKIDEIVYELYSLSDEEIEMVEGING